MQNHLSKAPVAYDTERDSVTVDRSVAGMLDEIRALREEGQRIVDALARAACKQAGQAEAI